MILKNSLEIGRALLPLQKLLSHCKSEIAVRHAQPSLLLFSVPPGLRGEDPHLFFRVIRAIRGSTAGTSISSVLSGSTVFRLFRGSVVSLNSECLHAKHTRNYP
jgi:hypothetical protein